MLDAEMIETQDTITHVRRRRHVFFQFTAREDGAAVARGIKLGRGWSRDPTPAGRKSQGEKSSQEQAKNPFHSHSIVHIQFIVFGRRIILISLQGGVFPRPGGQEMYGSWMLHGGGEIIELWEVKHVCRRMLICACIRMMGADCLLSKISSQKANKGS